MERGVSAERHANRFKGLTGAVFVAEQKKYLSQTIEIESGGRRTGPK